MIRTAIAIGVLLGMSGCESECQPVPDGTYHDAAGNNYTVQDGVPIGFQGWVCAPGDACGTLECSNNDQTFTVTYGPAMSVTVAPLSCDIPPTDSTGYQDCGGVTKGGYYCVAACGYLPPDGSPGALVAPGCVVQIGTTTPATALCVASCGECQ
jgi:hypothetical protein